MAFEFLIFLENYVSLNVFLIIIFFKTELDSQ